MRRQPHRRFVSLAAATALALATPVLADELPPQEAPAYTGVYQLSSRSKVNATDDWQFTKDDTVTIAVRDNKARWDHKSDGLTLLIDRGVMSTSFGGKTPPNTALRSRMPSAPIGWEFGYATVAAATPEKPQVLGTTTIAGKECTRITFNSTQYGKPEFCVAKTGIVLRFANKSSTAEATYEAQSVTETAPDKDRFAVPAGYTVEERRPPNRNVQIF
jgi:hypothetical protein